MGEMTFDDFDDMHHALGRPVSPDVDTYRNYFCCDPDSVQARRFDELEGWDFLNQPTKHARFYGVNGVGKQLLAEWMKTPEGIRTVRMHNPPKRKKPA